MSELENIAKKMVAKGKGILAADESTGTMTKRLENVKIESSAKNRLLFRETLFNSESMNTCIGGVILYDETIKQISATGKKITVETCFTDGTAGTEDACPTGNSGEVNTMKNVFTP